MTIYNLNQGIGWASSGVEYAQAYRASILRKLNLEAKFIFTDLFQSENLAHYTANIGFKDDEVIWLYGAFTDVSVAPTTFTVADLEETFLPHIQKVKEDENSIRYYYASEDLYVTAYLRKHYPQFVQRVEYASRGKLIRKDYYSYTKIFSEYYAPRDGQAYVYQRTFFNEDGSVAFEENCEGKQSLFRFKDALIESHEALLGRFLDQLSLTSKDMLIIDRATGSGQPVLKHKGDAKAVVVIHAEHYSENATTDDNILWNNYYEYQFNNAHEFDAFITSTDAQKNTLEKQFEHYIRFRPKIRTIPVGSLEALRHNDTRRHCSVVTCSRLAGEKHIDWLIQAVVKAHEQLSDLTFDIYGEGAQRSFLTDLIAEHNAADDIRLMGHHDLTDVYKGYEVYLAGSTSEGFGLTLMEAVGSGLPIIGLDVPYGNQTFVEDDVNGYLIPRLTPDDAQLYANIFADKLVTLYQQDKLNHFRTASYHKASGFLRSELEKAWLNFVEEVIS